MTYLELCQRLRQECGISGTGPSAVTSQTGEMKRVVDWVKDAWTEIQSRKTNWKWMRRPFTVNTVLGDGIYAYGDCTDVDANGVITRFKKWWADDAGVPFTIYRLSDGVAGERDLPYLDLPRFRWLYRRGNQVNQTPLHVSVDNASNIVIGPAPNAVYVVNGEFQRSAQVLAANGDTPEMPSDFHMLIVYKAMMKYAGYESAPEVYDIGKTEGNKVMRQLEANQLPPLGQAEPLA